MTAEEAIREALDEHSGSRTVHGSDCGQKVLEGIERRGIVLVPSDVWPWPGNTRLPWQVWNEVPHPDGMTIYDPDGFRNGKPTVVTWSEFERARMECTLVARGER